jgi:hypothetical protein
MKRKLVMSKELSAMLEASSSLRKATRPAVHNRRIDKLDRIGKRILRKAGFIQPKAEYSTEIPADCCGTNGLRPTWHGRAS